MDDYSRFRASSGTEGSQAEDFTNGNEGKLRMYRASTPQFSLTLLFYFIALALQLIPEMKYPKSQHS